MGITYGDHLIDSGYYDIAPEQEREMERAECPCRHMGDCDGSCTHPPPPADCPTCGGRGEVGWFDHAEGAYRNERCPDCQKDGVTWR